MSWAPHLAEALGEPPSPWQGCVGSLSGLLTGRALRATQGMEWLPGEPALAGPAPPFSHCLEFRLQVSGLPFGGGGGQGPACVRWAWMGFVLCCGGSRMSLMGLAEVLHINHPPF